MKSSIQQSNEPKYQLNLALRYSDTKMQHDRKRQLNLLRAYGEQQKLLLAVLQARQTTGKTKQTNSTKMGIEAYTNCIILGSSLRNTKETEFYIQPSYRQGIQSMKPKETRYDCSACFNFLATKWGRKLETG